MKLEVVILAAGEGTRMRSSRPKVLHELGGTPLLQHVLNAAAALGPSACHVVVGRGAEEVRAQLQQPGISWVEQAQQLGTGHAVLQAMPAVSADATVLVLYADVPLIRPETLRSLLTRAQQGPALLTAEVPDPTGYGRILRDADGGLLGVVEERDATDAQRQIREINSGILAAPAALLSRLLPRVGRENAQGEYYLPDILALAAADGVPIATDTVTGEEEILGVNNRAQLNRLEREYQRRQAQALMAAGVSLADAARIDVRGTVRSGADGFIDSNVLFEGDVVLGENVKIGANCVLIDCQVGDGAEIKPFSHLEGVTVGAGCAVGPFARLRPDTVLDDGVRIGNFVETKKARIGAGSKVSHLSYIGDCEMGAGVNIGAGTITCNYDGANKHRTRMGDNVFVGSNATLVAPLEIADGGFVGAGSTITRAVEPDQLAISRARQRNLDGWKRPRKEER